MPEIKSWEETTKPFRESAKKSRFTKSDLDKVIKEVKGIKILNPTTFIRMLN